MMPNYFEVPELAEERPHLATVMAQVRRWVIVTTLNRNDGSLVDTARDLQIGYSTLKTYLKAYRGALPAGALAA